MIFKNQNKFIWLGLLSFVFLFAFAFSGCINNQGKISCYSENDSGSVSFYHISKPQQCKIKLDAGQTIMKIQIDNDVPVDIEILTEKIFAGSAEPFPKMGTVIYSQTFNASDVINFEIPENGYYILAISSNDGSGVVDYYPAGF